MKQILAIIILWFGLSGPSFSVQISKEETVMSANGTFEVDLTAKEDVGSPAGRMLIKKTYLGDMKGSGIGQMISKRTENGLAVYYAIEEFSGSVKGSGSGELQDISGSMLIVQDASGHRYELTFEL